MKDLYAAQARALAQAEARRLVPRPGPVRYLGDPAWPDLPEAEYPAAAAWRARRTAGSAPDAPYARRPLDQEDKRDGKHRICPAPPADAGLQLVPGPGGQGRIHSPSADGPV